MSDTHWIVEGRIDERWPINTRGNIGEVFPEVLTPLSYELGVVPAEAGWRDAYEVMGIMRKDDFSTTEPVIIGLYGGYGYLNLSYLRMMGVRAPGSSAEAIDVSFFGEGNPPPYEPRKGDKSIGSSLKILRTVMSALGQSDLPDIVAESNDIVARYESRQPALDAPDDVIIRYLREFPTSFRPAFRNHLISTSTAAIVAGILGDACAAAGNAGLVTHLIGAAGDVKSAEYANELWTIAQHVRGSEALRATFDGGVDGLLDRLGADDDSVAFKDQFDAFVDRHGHRGPNDWELSSRTWENTPELALTAIDRMRLAETDLSPSQRLGDDQAKRDAAIAEVRPHLKFMDKMNFDKAVDAVGVWSQAREATRDRAVRCSLSFKRLYREMVRRAAERGGDPDPLGVAMLRPSDEWAGYFDDPASHRDTINERMALRDRFAAVEPPFFIEGQAEVPSIEQLEANAAESTVSVGVGDTLSGDAGSSGVAQGRVRVVMDPAEATDLEPGEVLVAPLTDPAWTPLFLPAAAVVVNVGAFMSHAVIVSRELGIPCVVAVEGATSALQDGMLVEVDGTAGTVKVLEG